MAFTTNFRNIDSQSGNESQVLIGEQADYSDESVRNLQPAVISATGVKSGGDPYLVQPLLNSASLRQEGTTIPSEFLDGSAAQSQDAPGPYDIGGGFSIGLSANGTALPFRMLTQDKNPLWYVRGTALTTHSRTLPPTVNVVANTERLKESAADATIADDLSSTTWPVQLEVTFGSAATYAAGSTRALITFEGTDHEDNPFRQTKSLITPVSVWRPAGVKSDLWLSLIHI